MGGVFLWGLLLFGVFLWLTHYDTNTLSHPSSTTPHNRDNILRTARVLVEDTKVLVASSSQQQQLQTAAKQAASTVSKLVDYVRDGAASLGADNSDSQVS